MRLGTTDQLSGYVTLFGSQRGLMSSHIGPLILMGINETEHSGYIGGFRASGSYCAHSSASAPRLIIEIDANSGGIG